jgi:hypothetical protein
VTRALLADHQVEVAQQAQPMQVEQGDDPSISRDEQ